MNKEEFIKAIRDSFWHAVKSNDLNFKLQKNLNTIKLKGTLFLLFPLAFLRDEPL